MLQYLISSSCIWTISLLFYYIFLRKETFFQWNRLYLILTCMLGLLLPLYTFNFPAGSGEEIAVSYYHQAVTVKDHLIQPAVNTDVSFGLLSTGMFLYAAGLVVMLMFFCRDLFRIYRLYRRGSKYAFQQWRIIETNQHHSPFSWRNLLFISRKEDYTASEFEIISRHENIHYRKQHFADLLFVSLLQLIFWFNPLVLIYKNLIRLTHEFEADNLASYSTKAYGEFLIEQAIGNFRPALIHTFSSSPLKNRLMMLTQKKSTRLKAMKYLAIVPVLLFSFVMVSYAQKKLPVKKDLGNGKFEYNGNTFEKSSATAHPYGDTIQTHTADGQVTSVVIDKDGGLPDILNGEVVQNPEHKNCTKPYLNSSEKDLSHYLFRKFKSDFEKLPDNEYEIHMVNFIIDKNGKVALIERLYVGGISVSDFSKLESRKPITDQTQSTLKQLSQLMSSVVLFDTDFKPAVMNGKTVHAKYWEPSQRWQIVVRNGEATIKENNE